MPAQRGSLSLAAEQLCWDRGDSVVAGVDEVGRGAWAGPVVAAAVVLPSDPSVGAALDGVRDSKLLTARQRERLVTTIYTQARAVGIGYAAASVVDAAGLIAATTEAMHTALRSVCPAPTHVLLDGLPLAGLCYPHTAIVQGDRQVLSIAAASIVAKVARDRLLAEMDRIYPVYGFAAHKGYGTAQHRRALQAHGPSPLHRYSYAPVAACARTSTPEAART